MKKFDTKYIPLIVLALVIGFVLGLCATSLGGVLQGNLSQVKPGTISTDNIRTGTMQKIK